MKCFNHEDRDAVGICKTCNKGICRECCVDVGNGIACKGPCEDEVKILNEVIGRSKTAYKKTGRAYFTTAITTGMLAVVFTGIGLLGLLSHNYRSLLFLLLVGLVFFFSAAVNVYNGISISKK